MFEGVAGVVDQLRHLLLNPPLAPGGGSSPGGVSGSLIGDDDALGNANNDPLILRYLPLLVLLSLFWPVLLTLIAASISASAWAFWLAVGLAFGVIQLLYTLYNFAMIIWDVAALTVLKTMAMLRSYFRYYFYMMGDAAGIEIKGRKRRHGKKRRRKEWREEVDRATSYEEFCGIELYEPQQEARKAKASPKPKLLRRTVTSDGTDKGISPSKSGFGLRLRKRNTTPVEPSNSAPNSPGSPMRKIHSSIELDKKGHRRQGSLSRRSPSGGSATSPRSPLRRVSSTALLSESNDDSDEYLEGDESCPKWQKVVQDDLGMAGSMLLTTLARLKEARTQAIALGKAGTSDSDDDQGDGGSYDDIDIPERTMDRTQSVHVTDFSRPIKGRPWNEDYSSSLKTLLSGIVKRNHLSVDDFLMTDARSVAERGQHSLKKETREAIDRYGEEVERCMDWVASGPVYLGGGGEENTRQQVMQKQQDELSKRYTLLKRMKQNMGHTALMLSGGGAQAMYHLGTIKALVESGLYQQIRVVSGTSGGSIAAAMCAIKKPEELIKDICVNTVSSDYMLNGEMGRQKVSWFPSMWQMGAYWMKHRLLMDGQEFLRCCQFYYGDITFEEAFEMTQTHVCITVSASRASSGSGVQRLLLNHISTPNVTLASSVAASCAVPGIMAPAKLMIKDSRGKLVPFEVDGVEWIDGSVQADLPFKRISTLFNISNFVVCQTNFHVVPFLNKAHHPNINTLYWKMFQMCMRDISSRVLNLSQLGLFPKLFGQDLSKMFKQKYFGKLTLVPRFTTLQVFGLKVLSNPTVKDMDVYLQNGQLAAWPFLRVLKEMLRIESAIEEGLTKLDQRLQSVASGFESLHNDDVESLSSAVGVAYRAHLPGLGREAELLKEKVRDLEQENKQLRQKVVRLQRSLGISSVSGSGIEGRLVVTAPHVEEEDESPSEEKKE
ncbi:hypothetical protein ACHAXT_009364 [Thalassiosira profunda]